ncbi:MAG: YfiR/HmsC family protein [Bacteroidota bacterium]|nr:YfiR/HmsC family protein [Bacteroidota bacterium]
MRRILIILLYVFIFSNVIVGPVCIAQENSKVKAAFIYNFPKYIIWPNENNFQEFSIGILGIQNHKLHAELERISKSRTINNLPIIVKVFKTIDEITPTQILYANGQDGIEQQVLFNKITGKGILLVGENLEDFNLSMINFIEQNKRQVISINQKVIAGENIKVSEKLIAAAITNEKEWNDVYSKFNDLLKGDDKKITVTKKDIHEALQSNEMQKKENEELLKNLQSKIQVLVKQESEIGKQTKNLILQELEIKDQSQKLLDQELEIEKQTKKIEAQIEYVNKQTENIIKQNQKINDQKNTLKIQMTQIQAQKVMMYQFLGVLGLFISLVGFIYWSYRQKKKANSIILEQKTLVDAKNKEITDSINYAKRIQQAKLPKLEEIYASFPKSFILYKPKDIVSGDFYFYHKNQKSAFIAAVDCTGHGVPGAFMSIIGSEKLDDAVSLTNNTSDILKLLNKGIKTSLRQSESIESTRDGMDIALCAIDLQPNGEKVSLKYAGANRPIWIIRKGKNKIEEIRATKKAIGGFTEYNQHFDTHEVQLKKGDNFYIFSDGYADTFSGKDDKKLKTRKFKQILLEIQKKSMPEQEKHLNTFIENWKDGTEQVDDILVIGVQV